MSFLLRAVLVIAALSWLALQRRDMPIPGPTAGMDRAALAQAALAAWGTLPDAAREAALREGRAETVRRIGGSAAQSRDTLLESDRGSPWRGTQTRADADRVTARGERSVP